MGEALARGTARGTDPLSANGLSKPVKDEKGVTKVGNKIRNK